jgi:hypothetical protein
MGKRDGVKFVEGTPNQKRTAAKKARGFGMGKIGSTDKAVIDAWAQSHDPMFKLKGIERHRKLLTLK